jgi:branched-chain amino acid transport system permease protein
VGSRFITLLGLGLLGLAFAFPVLVKDSYYQHIMNVIFLFAISVYGFNVITGIAGQFNIAHAGFIGIGAYASALVTTRLSLSFWAAMPLSVLATAAFGFLIGYPSLRLRGVYFALTTLAFGEILSLVFENWISVTGGPMGITRIPPPTPIHLPGGVSLAFDDKTGFYYLCLIFLLIAMYVNRQLLRSRLGRAMLAVRENEDLAQSVGVPIARTKMVAFVLATMFLGLTGSLYAHYFRFISPVSFSAGESFRHVTMLIVGGKGTLLGPLVGAVIFTALPEVLRSIEDYQWIAYGVILMLCVVFLPKGLAGWLQDFRGRQGKGTVAEDR